MLLRALIAPLLLFQSVGSGCERILVAAAASCFRSHQGFTRDCKCHVERRPEHCRQDFCVALDDINPSVQYRAPVFS